MEYRGGYFSWKESRDIHDFTQQLARQSTSTFQFSRTQKATLNLGIIDHPSYNFPRHRNNRRS